LEQSLSEQKKLKTSKNITIKKNIRKQQS